MEWIPWLGYIASGIVLISLVMKSLKKLRIINLIGAFIFAFYALMIAAYPVLIMNIGIVLINLFYLKQIYGTKDYFQLIEVNAEDAFMLAFIDYYKQDLLKHMAFKDTVLKDSTYRTLIVRNMQPAGLFIAQATHNDALEITLDYATPQYQDFKTGPYVFEKLSDLFKSQGYQTLIAYASSDTHEKYLKRMGFKRLNKADDKQFVMQL